MQVKCETCGWKGKPSQAEGSVSAYHDMICPECRSSNLDTSEIKKADPKYGFGDHNTLDTFVKPPSARTKE